MIIHYRDYDIEKLKTGFYCEELDLEAKTLKEIKILIDQDSDNYDLFLTEDINIDDILRYEL